MRRARYLFVVTQLDLIGLACVVNRLQALWTTKEIGSTLPLTPMLVLVWEARVCVWPCSRVSVLVTFWL